MTNEHKNVHCQYLYINGLYWFHKINDAMKSGGQNNIIGSRSMLYTHHKLYSKKIVSFPVISSSFPFQCSCPACLLLYKPSLWWLLHSVLLLTRPSEFSLLVCVNLKRNSLYCISSLFLSCHPLLNYCYLCITSAFLVVLAPVRIKTLILTLHLPNPNSDPTPTQL